METTPHKILLRLGDFEYLRLIHPSLTPTAVIRQLVSNYVDAHKQEPAPEAPEVDVSGL